MRLVLALVCAALCLLAQPGVAQEAAASDAVTQDVLVAPPSVAILTLDDERLFTGSAFGKAVIARQDADSQALIDENRRIEAALEAEEKDLDGQLQNLGFTPTIYSPHQNLVDEEMIKQCHEKGMKVIPWTVNELKDVKSMIQLGVDEMFTDYPSRTLKNL